MSDVNDFSDIITTLPDEMADNAILRPDIDEIDVVMEQLRRMPPELMPQMGIDIPNDIQNRMNQGRNLRNQNVLSALIYSMMPWVNPIQANNDNNANNNNNNANENGNGNEDNKNNEIDEKKND